MMARFQDAIRWSHLALILGGVLAALLPSISASVSILTWALLVSGLLGVHLRQAGRIGWSGQPIGWSGQPIGWPGHLAISAWFLSTILPALLRSLTGRFILAPDLAMILISGLQIVSILAYGLVTRKAQVLPKSVSTLLFISIPLLVILGGLGFNLCLADIGWILWRTPPVNSPSS